MSALMIRGYNVDGGKVIELHLNSADACRTGDYFAMMHTLCKEFLNKPETIVRFSMDATMNINGGTLEAELRGVSHGLATIQPQRRGD